MILILFILERLLNISLLIPSGMYCSYSEKFEFSKGRMAMERFSVLLDENFPLVIYMAAEKAKNRAAADIKPITGHFFSRKGFFL
ncbi:MAG: hypothetical protein KAT69_07585, partial [Candidatus Aminicenantes bacterium]|nr:hypothetical protein [Candidatus Aminicenantes bacterium]